MVYACVFLSSRMNLSLVKELGDRAAQGRAFGNLGNTHYLLGNFVEAIKFHREVSSSLENLTIIEQYMSNFPHAIQKQMSTYVYNKMLHR